MHEQTDMQGIAYPAGSSRLKGLLCTPRRDCEAAGPVDSSGLLQASTNEHRFRTLPEYLHV